MRTTNVHHVWNVTVKHTGNGAFTVEVRYGKGPRREPARVVLHFDAFFMVGQLARGLWDVVTARREQLDGELGAAEKSLRGDK